MLKLCWVVWKNYAGLELGNVLVLGETPSVSHEKFWVRLAREPGFPMRRSRPKEGRDKLIVLFFNDLLLQVISYAF